MLARPASLPGVHKAPQPCAAWSRSTIRALERATLLSAARLPAAPAAGRRLTTAAWPHSCVRCSSSSSASTAEHLGSGSRGTSRVHHLGATALRLLTGSRRGSSSGIWHARQSAVCRRCQVCHSTGGGAAGGGAAGGGGGDGSGSGSAGGTAAALTAAPALGGGQEDVILLDVTGGCCCCCCQEFAQVPPLGHVAIVFKVYAGCGGCAPQLA